MFLTVPESKREREREMALWPGKGLKNCSGEGKTHEKTILQSGEILQSGGCKSPEGLTFDKLGKGVESAKERWKSKRNN